MPLKKQPPVPPVPTADELALAADFQAGITEVVAAFAGAGGRAISSSVTVIFSCDSSATELSWIAPSDGAIVNVSASASTFAMSLNVAPVQRVIGAQTVYTDQIISSNTLTPGVSVSGVLLNYVFKAGDIIRVLMQAGSSNMIHVFCVLFTPLSTDTG